jgi:hypothetical protein
VSAEIGCFPQLSPASLDIGRLVVLREVNLPAQSSVSGFDDNVLVENNISRYALALHTRGVLHTREVGLSTEIIV